MLRIESDQRADALYIHISTKAVKYTRELTPDIAVDFAEDDTPVGIDVQRVSDLARELVYVCQGEHRLICPGIEQRIEKYNEPRR